MNDQLLNIDSDVNFFNNIYPDLNVNQSCEYNDYIKFNKLSMNSDTDLMLLNFNMRSIGCNFDTFNCFTIILIEFTVSDGIVRSWMWSTATRSSPLGYFSRLLQVVDN